MKYSGIFLLFCAIICTLGLHAQRGGDDRIVLPARIIDGDTVAMVDLPVVVIFPPLEFESNRERRRFYRMVRHVKKVYPYARLAGIEFQKVERRLDSASSHRERREIAREVEEKLEKRYKDDLKRLTFTQGRILIKLIDRETSHTSYALLQDMRGRLSASFWQSLGRLFGYNLREGYDPDNNDFDHQIETIVRMIEAGAI